MALRVVTVKASGGDYGSANTAFAGEEANLPALDRQLRIDCYNFEDTGGRGYLDKNRWTVDATHYVTVTVPPGERHDGRWSTSGYRLKVAGGWATGINTQLAYTHLEWLQVEDNMSVSAGSGFSITGENCEVFGCITKFTGVATAPKGFQIGPAANGTWLRNCLAFDYRNGSGGRGFSVSTDTAGALEMDNCGAQNCYNGFAETWQAPILKNCWAQDCDDGFGGTWHGDSDYNISDLASDAPGAHSKNETTILFRDKDNDDFRKAKADTEARGAGVDLSADFTDDIEGHVRKAPWDIGPDQYVYVVTPDTSPVDMGLAPFGREIDLGETPIVVSLPDPTRYLKIIHKDGVPVYWSANPENLADVDKYPYIESGESYIFQRRDTLRLGTISLVCESDRWATVRLEL